MMKLTRSKRVSFLLVLCLLATAIPVSAATSYTTYGAYEVLAQDAMKFNVSDATTISAENATPTDSIGFTGRWAGDTDTFSTNPTIGYQGYPKVGNGYIETFGFDGMKVYRKLENPIDLSQPGRYRFKMLYLERTGTPNGGNLNFFIGSEMSGVLRFNAASGSIQAGGVEHSNSLINTGWKAYALRYFIIELDVDADGNTMGRVGYATEEAADDITYGEFAALALTNKTVNYLGFQPTAALSLAVFEISAEKAAEIEGSGLKLTDVDNNTVTGALSAAGATIKYAVDAALYNLTSAKCYVALYDGNELADVKSYSLTNGANDIAGSFTNVSLTGNGSIKVMAWEDDNLKPLCGTANYGQ